jgi:hypothetical protein
MEPSLGLIGVHLFVFLGAGNGGGAQLYAQDQSKIATRSYSDSTNQLSVKHNMMGPVLQMTNNMEASQPAAAAVLPSPSQNLMLGGNTALTGLALGPPQSSLTPSSSALTSLGPGSMSVASGANDWQQPRGRDMRGQDNYGRMVPAEEVLNEDELQARSMEFLENEDMHSQIQQLLRMFNQQGADIPFSPYGPLPVEDPFPYMIPNGENENKNSPRVGWLKLKAALHWGIFIRKQAAARRAQLEEVDDE